MDLRGKTAIVSGGASGLGEATTRRLAGEGCNVLVFDLHEGRGAELEKEFSGQVTLHLGDVTQESQVQAAIDETLNRYRSLHIAVNCAGIVAGSKTVGKVDGVPGPHPFSLFNSVIQVNLIGTFNVMRLAAFAMQGNEPDVNGERGIVINTSSVAAFDGQIGQIAYAASKGAIASMTLPAARDLASAGVRVMAIAPGLFETPLLSNLSEEVKTSLGRQVPFPPRLGKPAEFADLVAAIVRNPMLNGEVIRLDGAIRMAPR